MIDLLIANSNWVVVVVVPKASSGSTYPVIHTKYIVVALVVPG